MLEDAADRTCMGARGGKDRAMICKEWVECRGSNSSKIRPLPFNINAAAFPTLSSAHSGE